MQKQFVSVEYSKRWYGTGQRCLMRWAGGDTQSGVETDRGRSRTSGGDMELRCPLEALGHEDRFGYRGPQGQFILACRVRDSSINHEHWWKQISSSDHLTRPQTGPQSSPHVNAPPRIEPMASRKG